MFKIGAMVTRKSYNNDIIFKIIDICDEIYYLKGINVRLIADSYVDDLKLYSDEIRYNDSDLIKNIDENLDRNNFFYLPGKILHIDGDISLSNNYLIPYKIRKTKKYKFLKNY